MARPPARDDRTPSLPQRPTRVLRTIRGVSAFAAFGLLGGAAQAQSTGTPADTDFSFKVRLNDLYSKYNDIKTDLQNDYGLQYSMQVSVPPQWATVVT